MKIRLLRAVEVTIENGCACAEGRLKFKQSKNELVVEGIGGGISIQNVFGNGMSISNMGGSVYVNGVRVDGGNNKNDKDYVKMNVPLNGVKICSVECSGASTLRLSDKNVLDNDFDVELSGASTMRVARETIARLSVNVSGASGMKGVLETDRLDAHISGCSKVNGVHVNKSGSVHASGCSSAYVSTDHKKKISTHSSGMSTIKINKQQAFDPSSSSDSSDSDSDSDSDNDVPLIKQRKVNSECPRIEKKFTVSDEKKKEMERDAVLYEVD